MKRSLTGHRIGEHHQKAKLSDLQVADMRKMHESGIGYRKLSQAFGCGQSTARDICTYRTRY